MIPNAWLLYLFSNLIAFQYCHLLFILGLGSDVTSYLYWVTKSILSFGLVQHGQPPVRHSRISNIGFGQMVNLHLSSVRQQLLFNVCWHIDMDVENCGCECALGSSRHIWSDWSSRQWNLWPGVQGESVLSGMYVSTECWSPLFRSTLLQSWPNKAGRKCPSIRAYVHTYVHTSIHLQKFFHFHKIRRVGRGRWVMHNCMQYDPIQGQGHKPFRVGNPPFSTAISSAMYNGSWQLTTDS